MADVRSSSGIPSLANFGGTASPSPGTPLYVDIATGDLYTVLTGDVVTRIATSGTATGLSGAGTTQGTATSVTASVNYFSTVAAGSGAVLTTGPYQTIYNAGVNSLKVYPPSGAKINQLATNAPILLSINTCATFYYLSATQWIGSLSA